ncbi:MAG: nucleotidyltransferase domain-containing protein [Methanomassiliicoccaceae archaeon]|nr:nucleotidyltransferase domain-containing protein [Methanomassiliicoccaceae archaeon]
MSSKTNKRLSIEELKALVAPIADEYGVGKVYLFGSVARGDDNEDSDYDFCVERGKIDCILILSEFFKDLHDAVGSEIDMVTTKSVNSEFLNRIIKEGVVLYGAT